MKKSCSVDGKCPNFSVQLCLWMRGKLMLANFGLKIRPRKPIFLFFSQIKGFGGSNLHHVSYLRKRYLWRKNERNQFFNSCHSLLNMAWPLLLRSWSRLHSQRSNAFFFGWIIKSWKNSCHKQGSAFLVILDWISSSPPRATSGKKMKKHSFWMCHFQPITPYNATTTTTKTIYCVQSKIFKLFYRLLG